MPASAAVRGGLVRVVASAAVRGGLVLVGDGDPYRLRPRCLPIVADALDFPGFPGFSRRPLAAVDLAAVALLPGEGRGKEGEGRG